MNQADVEQLGVRVRVVVVTVVVRIVIVVVTPKNSLPCTLSMTDGPTLDSDESN